MHRYAYYVCFKCDKAYYGGEARCDLEAGVDADYDPAELVCGACSDVSRAQMCPKHGTDFLEYKCRYCCSVAVFFCFGTTHFCNPCHDDFQVKDAITFASAIVSIQLGSLSVYVSFFLSVCLSVRLALSFLHYNSTRVSVVCLSSACVSFQSRTSDSMSRFVCPSAVGPS